jgi:hypothetical protein
MPNIIGSIRSKVRPRGGGWDAAVVAALINTSPQPSFCVQLSGRGVGAITAHSDINESN